MLDAAKRESDGRITYEPKPTITLENGETRIPDFRLIEESFANDLPESVDAAIFYIEKNEVIGLNRENPGNDLGLIPLRSWHDTTVKSPANADFKIGFAD